MAKKKARYKKRKTRKRLRTTNHYDRHHILWQRAKWNRGALRQLRDYYYCIIMLPKETLHKYIHSRVSQIPVPREIVTKDVLAHLDYLTNAGAISDNDSIEKRLKVLIALFECIEEPTATALKKQLIAVREYKNSPS